MTDQQDQPLGTSPSRVGQQDLAGAFAPDRTGGLRGRGRPSTSTTPTPPDPGDDAEAPANKDSADQPTSRRRGRSKGRASRATAHRDEDQQRPRTVVVYMPPQLLERLREHSRNTGRSYTVIALDAIAAHHENLDEIFADLAPASSHAQLFPPRRRSLKTAGGPRVQVGLRPTGEELEIIDRLVRDHNLPSRTELVVRVLDRALGSAEDSAA